MYSPAAIALFARVKAVFDPRRPAQPRRARPARRGSTPTSGVAAARRRADGPGARLPARRRRLLRPRCTAAPASASAAPTCRRGGVMCPSWPATREEKDSTRGRARVLQEMLAPGGPVRLALARGARRARPVPVLQGLLARLPRPVSTWRPTRPRCCTSPTGAGCARPRTTRSGWLPRWADAGSRAAARRRVAKVAIARRWPRSPWPFARRLAEAGPRRAIGPAARHAAAVRPADLPAAVGRRGPSVGRRRPGRGRRWLLWVDTFTDHFAPEVGAGRRAGAGGAPATAVQVPRRHRVLRADLDLHRPARRRPAAARPDRRRAGPSLVDGHRRSSALEPSCTAVLRGDAARAARRRPRRAARRRAHPHAGRAADRHAPGWTAARPRRAARSSPSRTATTTRCWAGRADAALLARAGARGHRGSAAAAAWPATSASSAATTTCRWRSPSSSCCPPSARGPATRSCSPTASPAAPSSTSSPGRGLHLAELLAGPPAMTGETTR